MDFWKIVLIVFLLCAVIDLPYFVMELREDKRKKQINSPKSDRQEAKTVCPEEEKKQIPQKSEEQKLRTPVKKEETNLFLVLYHMIQQEQWKHKIPVDPGIVQRLNQIHHNLACQGIQEPEYTTVIRFQSIDTILWPTAYCTFYSYDDNGVLRKIEETYPDCYRLPAHECLVDTKIFDEKGVIVRHCPAFADKNINYRGKAPFLPIYQGAIRNGRFGYEKYALTMEDINSDAFEPRPIATDGSEPSWFHCVPKAGERRTIDYWFGNPVFPKIYNHTKDGFHVVKCAPRYEEPLKKHLQEAEDGEIQVLTGECGDEMSWKQVGDVLYIAGQGEIEEYAFYGDSSIRKVVIAEGCTGIGANAFFECVHLEEADLPEGLLSIGIAAFFGCEKLTLKIPNSVRRIEASAVQQVADIIYHGPKIDVEDEEFEEYFEEGEDIACRGGSWKIEGNTLYVQVTGELPLTILEVCRGSVPRPCVLECVFRPPWYQESYDVEQVVIAPGCTKIGEKAFEMRWKLKTISIPGTVTEIEDLAFGNCEKLQSLVIPDGVVEIGWYAFEFCRGLTDVVLPERVKQIGPYCFYGCSSLASVTIPEGVEEVATGVFGNCRSLTSITIPKSVTRIGTSAFHHCSSLISVTIPDGVRQIHANAFAGCTGLVSVTIPDSVTEIGRDAFKGVRRIIYNGPAHSDDNWGALDRK